jgi:predicted nucleotidyltransferase
MRRISENHFREELARILAGLRRYRPQKVILFGSFARGDYHATSDIDLLIIKETKRPFTDRIGDVLALCDYSIPLEPLVYTPSEFEKMCRENNLFIGKVLQEGEVIYESEPSGSTSLDSPGTS